MAREESKRARGEGRGGCLGLLLLLALVLLLLVDLRAERPGASPALESALRVASGTLRVGAARREFSLPLPVTVGGYSTRRGTATGLATPLSARALVLEAGGKEAGRIALLSLDLLQIPERLADHARAAASQLGISDVVVAATHSHTSVGCYDDRLITQLAATGRFREEVALALEEAVTDALLLAAGSLAPAALSVRQVDVQRLSANRAWPGGPIDPRLTALSFDELESHRPIGRLLLFGAHPTLVPRGEPLLDGDYPARAMALLEASQGGVALFVQGALGDVRASPLLSGEGDSGQSQAELMGMRFAEVAEGAVQTEGDRVEAAELAFASVSFELPLAQIDGQVPKLLRRAGANIANLLLPERSRLSCMKLGELRLLYIPAEPTVAASEELLRRLGARAEGARIVGVAGPYVGYLELPSRFEKLEGEAKRAIYGPELLSQVERALESCLVALESL